MDVLNSIPQGLVAIITDLSQNLAANSRGLGPFVGVYFLGHACAEFIAPAVNPGIYDALARKAYGDKPIDSKLRVKLARDARTKLISILFSITVCAISLVGLVSDEGSGLQRDFYASTPLTDFLVKLAVGFFTWDIVVCVLDREPAEFVFHAVACWIVFTVALRPMVHYMTMITLLFEASTPFLHIRAAMLQAGYTNASPGWAGTVFTVVERCFGLFFFLSRIVLGYWKCTQWWLQSEALAAAGKIHNIPLLRLQQCLCLGLSSLNMYWFILIAQRAMGCKAKTATTKRMSPEGSSSSSEEGGGSHAQKKAA